MTGAGGGAGGETRVSAITSAYANFVASSLNDAVECLRPMDQSTPASRLVLLQGTLDMLILQTLQWGPQHGYAITQMIRARSSEALQVETGSLYPALHRLERQGWVKAEWGQTDTNQQAKFYRLTAGEEAAGTRARSLVAARRRHRRRARRRSCQELIVNSRQIAPTGARGPLTPGPPMPKMLR